MRTIAPTLAWMTDLHLDTAEKSKRVGFYKSIQKSPASAFIITGDISISNLLPLHLREIVAAAGKRSVYFTLGNHDFYGSSFQEVDRMVAGVCRSHKNLKHLSGTELVQLDGDTVLMGHRGWCDSRSGWGDRTLAKNPDFHAITDFMDLDQKKAFRLLRVMGEESAEMLRGLLPYALTCYQRVIIATHFPPFTQAARFEGKHCDWLRQPFFCNSAVGGMILRVAKNFPRQDIIVLCGHTHFPASVQVAPNVLVRCGAAQCGKPSTGVLLKRNPWMPNPSN